LGQQLPCQTDQKTHSRPNLFNYYIYKNQNIGTFLLSYIASCSRPHQPATSTSHINQPHQLPWQTDQKHIIVPIFPITVYIKIETLGQHSCYTLHHTTGHINCLDKQIKKYIIVPIFSIITYTKIKTLGQLSCHQLYHTTGHTNCLVQPATSSISKTTHLSQYFQS
jgi:hypothetical protein